MHNQHQLMHSQLLLLHSQLLLPLLQLKHQAISTLISKET
jgi:hypothetical protein